MTNKNINILIVDDSPTVRRLSELILAQEGYKVHTAEDGEQGLEIACRIHPAAILVDYVMPKMNGHTFCKTLRSDATMKDIPVILISSQGETIGQAFEEEFGILHYFTKPFEPEDLIQKLSGVLAAHRQATLAKEPESVTSAANTAITPDILDAFQERFDKVIRQYFHRDFPLLVKNIFSDTLCETGLVSKKTLVLSGNLTQVPLPDVINFAYNSRLSGRLTVFSRAVFGEIFIEDGHFVYAAVSRKGASHQFLTDLLCADGRLPQDKAGLTAVMEEARSQNLPIGKVLVNKGIISNKELMGYLQRHAQDAFSGILDVREGNFFLENEQLPLNLQDISFRIPLISVLMDGLRRQDEKQQAAVEFRDESVVLMRLITNEDALESYNFSENELLVFSIIDGKKSLEDLLILSQIDPLEVKRICYSLKQVGLLRVKEYRGR